jgi:DMSO/TMAO reductase YedYZ molybdopterin-dependent catalytic subunit
VAARLGGGPPGVLEVVADSVIRRLPPWLFDWAVKTLGPAANGLLMAFVCLGVPLAGAAIAVVLRASGLARARSLLHDATASTVAALALAELLVLPLAGAGFAGTHLLSDPAAVHGPLFGASLLYGMILAARLAGGSPAATVPGHGTPAGIARRQALARLAAVVGVGAWAASAAAVAGRVGGPPRSAVPGAPDLAGAEGFGFSRAVTPVPEFYVVSKDWVPLEVDRSSWRLRVTGLVEEPRDWTLDELRALPTHEAHRTLQCISAESITRTALIGSQRWAGVRVRDVLDAARPSPEARFIVWRCADGYHESLDLPTALEDDTWLVTEMGPPGTLLTADHGAPLRLLVAGRYGMAQPKYLTEMVLGADDEPGWWVTAGWQTAAPVRTYCRIDLPAADGVSDAVLAGTAFTAYGVASSGDRGISAVQVSLDGGETWRDAELEPMGGPIGRLTWVRWRAPVRLDAPGTLLFMARAADGTGQWQDEAVEEPFPRGASGYPRVPMRVYPSVDAAS